MVITDRLTLTPPAKERLAMLLIASIVPIFGAISLATLGVTALPTTAVAAIVMLVSWYTNQAIITGAAFDDLDQDVRDIDTTVARATVETRTVGAPASELKPDARARVIAAMAEGNLDPVRRTTARIYFGTIFGITLPMLLAIAAPHGSATMHLSWVALGLMQMFAGAVAPTAHAYIHLRGADGSDQTDDTAEPHLAASVPLSAAILGGGFIMLGMASAMRHAGPALAALLN